MWSRSPLLHHLSADPGGSFSAVGARRAAARVARVTLHAMRTAARAAASLQQPARVPYAAPAPLDMPVSIALGRLSCCAARALAGEIQRATLHVTHTAAGRTADERQLAHRPIISRSTSDPQCLVRAVHTLTSYLAARRTTAGLARLGLRRDKSTSRELHPSGRLHRSACMQALFCCCNNGRRTPAALSPLSQQRVMTLG